MTRVRNIPPHHAEATSAEQAYRCALLCCTWHAEQLKDDRSRCSSHRVSAGAADSATHHSNVLKKESSCMVACEGDTGGSPPEEDCVCMPQAGGAGA